VLKPMLNSFSSFYVYFFRWLLTELFIGSGWSMGSIFGYKYSYSLKKKRFSNILHRIWFMLNRCKLLIVFFHLQHWAFSDIRTGRVLTKCVSNVSSTQGKLQDKSLTSLWHTSSLYKGGFPLGEIFRSNRNFYCSNSKDFWLVPSECL
jgi:hypothetical protein